MKIDGIHKTLDDLARCEKEITRLRQRVAELEEELEVAQCIRNDLHKDAERWRELWIIPPDKFQIVLDQIYSGLSPEKAIDAAMEMETKTGEPL